MVRGVRAPNGDRSTRLQIPRGGTPAAHVSSDAPTDDRRVSDRGYCRVIRRTQGRPVNPSVDRVKQQWTVNKVLLAGRLTRDPEMRALASRKHVTQFTCPG